MALTKITGGVIDTTTSITAVGATFSGSVSVAGTITYDDVTNIDSVGLVTARSGIVINDGGLIVTGVTTVSAGSASVPSISPSGDGNTGIFFPSADTIGFAEGGAEALRIDSSGRLLVGATTTSKDFTVVLQGNSADSTGGANLLISRGTSSPADGSAIGYLSFTDSSHNTAAMIQAQRDGGTWTSGSSQPGRLLFSTTSDGSSSPTERMRISANGDINIDSGAFYFDAVNNRFGLGTTSPNNSLHIRQSGDTYDTALSIEASSSTARRLYVGVDHSAGAGVIGTDTHDLILDATGARSVISKTNGTERARIDGSGRLLVGTSTARTINGYNVWQGLQLAGTTGNEAIVHERYSNDGGGAHLFFGKSRSTSVGSYTSVQSGDALGQIVWCGADGTDMGSSAASIIAAVDGTPGANDMPGRLVFSTTADGAASPTERMRIDSQGRMGLGTTSPDGNVHIADSTRANLILKKTGLNDLANSSLANEYDVIQLGSGGSFASYNVETVTADTQIGHNFYSGSGGALKYKYADAAARIRFNANQGHIIFDRAASGTANNNITFSESLRIDSSGRLLVGTSSDTNAQFVVTAGAQVTGAAADANADRATLDYSGGGSARLMGHNSGGGTLAFFTNASGSGVSERMRISSDGTVFIAKTGYGLGTVGIELQSNGVAYATSNNNQVLIANRLSSDGAVIGIYQDTVQEGTISVSGSTVSYNGAHLSRWSQLPSGVEREEILRGTVLSNIDEMCEWGDEENEQLNRMQVSNVEGDPNVAGVFQAWDDDDDTYTNDFYCAMTGDFVIRIAQGVTVQRGNLLMSAGDGTAKPQGDGYIQDKTIAKVTSTNVSCTYDDGSYCVPCVLMAC